MAAAPKTRFIAFYSYKGGVGRTLALANCARALARMGKTVALLDLDLEAPGLDQFDAFRPKGEKAAGRDAPYPTLAGFAEYLAECRREGPPRSLAGYVHPCWGRKGDKGRVYLMPAGRRGGGAFRAILSLDWDRFYQDEDGYRIMENLRGHIAHNLGEDEARPIRPDYVLIDARTGLSETGGIATHQLADLVVLLFGLNRQNLEGTVWVHDSLSALPDPPRMLLVVSPLPEVMETGKGTLFQERMAHVRRHLHRAVNHQRPATLPYRPVLSWEERILVDNDDADYLGYDQPYRELLDLILETLGDPEVYLDRAADAWRRNDLDEARKQLDRARERFPEDGRVAAALERLGTPAGAPRVDLARLPAGSGHFLGRGAELAALDAAWAEGYGIAVVELIAPGGTGKTALVKRWLDGPRAAEWGGARRVYGWSFYSQGTDGDRQPSEDLFLTSVLAWFGIELPASANPGDKGRALAEVIAASRTLLVLDGLEPLQHPPGPLAGELRAPGLKALLTQLAAAGHPGLCVVTSREWLADLTEWVRGDANPRGPVLRLDLGNLSDADGAALLHARGATRAGAAPIAPNDAELIAASREVRGHALTLSLLGRYLARAKGGDIRQRDAVRLARADRDARGHAARIIAAYERWFAREGEARSRELAALRLMGFFDRPARGELIGALRAAPPIPKLTEPLQGLDAEDWAATLANLDDCGLVQPDPATGALDAHPLVREHLAERLRTDHPEAWREGHRRLYAWLKDGVPYRPDGLDGLQPLYQAVAHGCHAGLWQEVFDEIYLNRILRGTGEDGFYSTRKLGAFGADLAALACFFAEPWRHPAPALSEPAQAWLLNDAAFHLRALGRLAEAMEPMRAGAEIAARQERWGSAATTCSNLSGLQLTLGRVHAAIADARQGSEHADATRDVFVKTVARAALAHALHQSGEREEAFAGFAEAESIQSERQPEYPLLYSAPGFQYSELLLSGAERAAWGAGQGPADPEALGACRMAAWRAQTTLGWAEQNSPNLLDIALDHLTLARCALYADRLQGRPPGPEARDQAARALDRLRAAGQQDELPRGLLTRAWLRHAAGDPEGARTDLDEAHRIAARGGMLLHLADIALHRARLFQDRNALTEARRLIEQCGYARRLPELTDAEAAAGSWPHRTT